jgi:hypothetical protein
MIVADDHFIYGGLQSFTCETTRMLDWRVCLSEVRSLCVAWSWPIASVGTLSGHVVTFRRGDVALLVVQNPSNEVSPELLFFPGFPLGAETTLTIDEEQPFQTLVPDTQFLDIAFSESRMANDTTIAALQRGDTVVAQSSTMRNVELTDTFSLAGFEDALLWVEEVCPL